MGFAFIALLASTIGYHDAYKLSRIMQMASTLIHNPNIIRRVSLLEMYISDITASDKNISQRNMHRRRNERKRKKKEKRKEKAQRQAAVFEKPRKSDRRRIIANHWIIINRRVSGAFLGSSIRRRRRASSLFPDRISRGNSRAHAGRLIEAAGSAGNRAGNLHHPLLPALYGNAVSAPDSSGLYVRSRLGVFNEVKEEKERIRGRMYFCRER